MLQGRVPDGDGNMEELHGMSWSPRVMQLFLLNSFWDRGTNVCLSLPLMTGTIAAAMIFIGSGCELEA